MKKTKRTIALVAVLVLMFTFVSTAFAAYVEFDKGPVGGQAYPTRTRMYKTKDPSSTQIAWIPAGAVKVYGYDYSGSTKMYKVYAQGYTDSNPSLKYFTGWMKASAISLDSEVGR